MTAGSTYTPIATYTAPSAQASYTFTSIPNTYTDLILIADSLVDGGGGAQILIRVNGDTGTNYSRTVLDGSGSSASSVKDSTIAYFSTGYQAYMTTARGFNCIAHFMNYSNTNTKKPILVRCGNANTGLDASIGLWRSNSAITSILVYPSGNNFATGSTFTLYGIAAA
jgi:hypothetical protein